MKIKEATIYGFGKWVDYTINFSDEPFYVIYGENESGKSSIQQFILFMLFGLPPKQREFFQPKTSSKMGGRLVIDDEIVGEITIERFHEKNNGKAICYTYDGNEHDETWLMEQLGEVDLKTYQSIYTFSALDLNEIKSMKEDNIGEVLLSVGLTGSTEIYAVEKQLDQQLADLFKPSGKRPFINQKLEEMKEEKANLERLKQIEVSYEQKKQTADQLDEEIKDMRRQLENAKATVITLEKKKQALPTVYEYKDYQEKLANLPSNINFPENGITRYQELKNVIVPLESKKTTLVENEESYLKEIEQLEQSLTQLLPYEQGVQLQDQFATYQENELHRKRLQESIQKLKQQMETELRNLNMEITVEDISSLSIPFHIEQTWIDLKKKKEQLHQEKEKLQEEFQILKNKQSVVSERLEELENQRLSEEKRRELQGTINNFKENQMLKKLQQEQLEKQKAWKSQRKKKDKMSVHIFLVSLIFAIICGGTSYFLSSAILLTIAIASVLFGTFQWIWNKKNTHDLEGLLKQPFPSINTEVNLQEVNTMEGLLQKDYDLGAEQATMIEQNRMNDLQQIQLDEKQTLLNQKESNLRSMLETQFDQYPFLRNVNVSFWPELYQSLKGILHLYHEIVEHKNKQSILTQKVESFHEQLQLQLLKHVKESIPDSVEGQIELVQDHMHSRHHTKEMLKKYHQLLLENRKEQQEIDEQLQLFVKERNQLWKTANAHSEEEFYIRAKEKEKQEYYQDLCQQIMKQYRSYFSNQDWEIFWEKPPSERTLELEHRNLSEWIVSHEDALEAKRQHLANAHSELQHLETSEDYSMARYQLEMKKEELKQSAHNWAVLKTAKEILLETKRSYQDKYLTKVIERTSSYFCYLTDGRYIQVIPPKDGQLFMVETQDMLRFSVHELSQGTINQLYVSLRIAISEVMREKHRLPFIIDDAFVHFDTTRTTKMMEILKKLSEKYQILIFTCKEETWALSNEQNRVELTTSVPLLEN